MAFTDVYNRLRAVLSDDLSRDELSALLARSAESSDWLAPAMDIYDSRVRRALDARRWECHMRIVEEDIVDWEPLRMRFIFKEPVADGRREALIAFLKQWFDKNSPPHETNPFFHYWGAEFVESGIVEASAEHMLPELVQPLAASVGNEFREVDHLRLGFAIEGPTTRAEFKWVRVPRGEVTLRGKSVAIGDIDISLHHVSLGQFEQFMRETGYRPRQDRVEGDGSLAEDLRLNVGDSPKTPAFGVSYGDASAFCRWASLRLPSEAELYAFFLAKATEGHQFKWTGECWTSDTEPDGDIVACEGPYVWALQESPPNKENRRASFPRDQYGYPEIGGFRVARTA